ncbi:MAG: prolyl oligopeptidase family serine peptidase [Saprospiraceae bacterium]|nr:prolyl oligopeptidase family serine peptidase [Saprospiraceae bacterium]
MTLWGRPVDIQRHCKKCSPLQYVDADDPPIFIAHGDQDNQVPINQSIELFGQCRKSDLNVVLEFVYGNGHGGYGFESNEMTQN